MRYRMAFLLVVSAGCASPPAAPSTMGGLAAPPTIQTVAHTTPAELALADLLELAVQRNPELIAARARIEVARGLHDQAGLYPNPTIGYQGNQINDGPGTSGQQGGFVGQEIVTGGKLGVAQSAAGHGVTAADAQAQTRWLETAARVKAAYAEALTAKAVAAESDRIVDEFVAGLAKAEALARAGTALAYEVSRWRVEVSQARYRQSAARQRSAAADRLLAAAVGLPELPAPLTGTALSPSLSIVDFGTLSTAAERSPALVDASERVEQAKCELRLAELQNTPNVMLQVAAAQDAPSSAAIANVQAGIMLPIWNRNQGHIHAAQARVAVALAEVEQLRLRQRERLAAAVLRVENSRRQIELLEREILPDATKAVEQVRQVYEVRGERFFETLDACRTLAQARIDRLNALGELQAGWAEIAAIVPGP